MLTKILYTDDTIRLKKVQVSLVCFLKLSLSFILIAISS